jgi:transposase
MSLRDALAAQLDQVLALEAQMRRIEHHLEEFAARDATTMRYQDVPGIGLLTATALRASVGPLARFASGRHLSAWIGMVPREHSSGSQRKLGRISKRGDGYLRTLLIHGARSVLHAAAVRRRNAQPLDRLQAWALDVQQRQGHNKAAVALANKLVRRLWAMEHHGKRFDANHCSVRPEVTH